MRRIQRAQGGRLVAEGRDMGSVVFPDAALKVFLDASLEERARRRHRERPEFSVEEYVERIRERDRLDSDREDSPLVKAPDAVVVDTSRLTIEEVVGLVETLARERLGLPRRPAGAGTMAQGDGRRATGGGAERPPRGER